MKKNLTALYLGAFVTDGRGNFARVDLKNGNKTYKKISGKDLTNIERYEAVKVSDFHIYSTKKKKTATKQKTKIIRTTSKDKSKLKVIKVSSESKINNTLATATACMLKPFYFSVIELSEIIKEYKKLAEFNEALFKKYLRQELAERDIKDIYTK